MSEVKIFDRSAPGSASASSSAELVLKTRPVADRLRGISLASGAFSHGTYVIQVRATPAPDEPQRSWASNEADELELELDAVEQTVAVRR